TLMVGLVVSDDGLLVGLGSGVWSGRGFGAGLAGIGPPSSQPSTGSDITSSPASTAPASAAIHTVERTSRGLRTDTKAPSSVRPRASTRAPGSSSVTAGPPGQTAPGTPPGVMGA